MDSSKRILCGQLLWIATPGIDSWQGGLHFPILATGPTQPKTKKKILCEYGWILDSDMDL